MAPPPPDTLLCPLYPQQNALRSVLDLSGARGVRLRGFTPGAALLRSLRALTSAPRNLPPRAPAAGLWDFQADPEDVGVAQRWRVLPQRAWREAPQAAR
jgi:hypothetical protein